MVLLWLKNFFSMRTHQTRVEFSLSDIAQLLSGVVQGSGIGPLMFLLYINELIGILERHGITVKVFADDVKMYLRVVNDIDVKQLQSAIDSLLSWAELWQLGISVDKCCVLNLGTASISSNLTIYNETLPIVPNTRDLGITVASNLSPALHINDIVSRAHKHAMLIYRTFESHDVNLLVRAYKTYVRPLVEYNSVVWSPFNLQDIDAIESVQRRFTKRLPGLGLCPYRVRLQRLNIQSLELRRLHSDLIWCYKIIFGLVDMDSCDFFTPCTVVSTRGHRYKVYKKSTSGVRSNFFCERVVNVWNKLTSHINISSIRTFKRSISNSDFSAFLKRY